MIVNNIRNEISIFISSITDRGVVTIEFSEILIGISDLSNFTSHSRSRILNTNLEESDSILKIELSNPDYPE